MEVVTIEEFRAAMRLPPLGNGGAGYTAYDQGQEAWEKAVAEKSSRQLSDER